MVVSLLRFHREVIFRPSARLEIVRLFLNSEHNALDPATEDQISASLRLKACMRLDDTISSSSIVILRNGRATMLDGVTALTRSP